MSDARAIEGDPADGLTIALEDPRTPEIGALIRALDDYLNALYPPELNYLLDVDELAAPEVALFVARLGGAAVGTAALVRHEDFAELKRMYVDPTARGHGLGRRLLEAVEALARAEDFAVIRLETGVDQPEALALYGRQATSSARSSVPTSMTRAAFLWKND